METAKEIFEYVWPHWPFIAFTLVIGVLAQVLKTQIFTKEIAQKNKVIFWVRRGFPILLIILGALVGVFWPGESSPGVDTTMEKVWYFMGAACVAIAGFNILKTWIKKKYDVDIMALDSEPPKS